jgi:hypothetical protein
LKILDIHSDESNFGIRTDANYVAEVELHFGAGRRAGEHAVVSHNRSVDYGRHHVARIATPHGDIAIQDADARHCPARLVLAAWLPRLLSGLSARSRGSLNIGARLLAGLERRLSARVLILRQ